MGRSANILSAAVALSACLAPWRSAQAAESFVTARGDTIELTSVASMDCEALVAKIVEIDATGYRGPHPVPKDASDRQLLSYERQVSARYYGRCGREQGLTVSEVLRDGFAARAAPK